MGDTGSVDDVVFEIELQGAFISDHQAEQVLEVLRVKL